MPSFSTMASSAKKVVAAFKISIVRCWSATSLRNALICANSSGRRSNNEPSIDAGLDHPAPQRLRCRDRQRSRYLGDRALPVKDFIDRSTTELWRVLRWTCHDDQSPSPQFFDHATRRGNSAATSKAGNKHSTRLPSPTPAQSPTPSTELLTQSS